jgi:hypothetical protein
VGPGHAGIYRHDDGRYYFSHHFYDAASGGAPSLALWHLVWVDGWPRIDGGPCTRAPGHVSVPERWRAQGRDSHVETVGPAGKGAHRRARYEGQPWCRRHVFLPLL